MLATTLVACGDAIVDDDRDGIGGNVPSASGRKGAEGGTGADSGGAAAGRLESGGGVSGRGGSRTSSGGDEGTAGRGPSGGATPGSGSGGTFGGGESGGRTGDDVSGGSGGNGASAPISGAGGETNEPGSPCADPMDTEDTSRLIASEARAPYFVSGMTAAQIRRSIDQNRARDYDAYTDWYVTWGFGDCNGNGLVVTVEVTYTYPEWDAPATASSDLVASWEAYMDALFCHEYGHAKHGLECANEVYTALAAIDAGGNCGEQQTKAAAAFDTILQKYNELDLRYDDDTSHGATMGAVFPP